MRLQNELNEAKQVSEKKSLHSLTSCYHDAQENLEAFYEEKTKVIIMRARACWHEYGEKSNKYFLNLEKRNHVKKNIQKLYINEKINTNPSNILKELERFYCKMYASDHNVPGIDRKRCSFLADLNVPKLSEEQKSKCEGKISSKECFDLLDSFHNNKTPRNDGIPIEFYKKFWPLISDSFIRCANECFEKGEMSCSQNKL